MATSEAIKPLTEEERPPHHIVFQRLGKMYPAAAYYHIRVPLHLKDTKVTIQRTRKQLADLLYAFRENTFFPVIKSIVKSTDNQLSALENEMTQLFDNGDYRTRRFWDLFGSILSGINSVAIMANSVQLAAIHNDISNLQQANNRLADISHIHDQQIHFLYENQQNLTELMRNYIFKNNPEVMTSQFQSVVFTINREVSILMDTVHSAQTHRLNRRLLTPAAVQDVLKHVQKKATQQGLVSPLSRREDLFSIDVSSILENGELYLYLHVPLVDPQEEMTLLKYHPLPLPVKLQNDTLMPKPEYDYLGLGSDKKYLEFSSDEIRKCQQFHHKRVCAGSGMTRRDDTASCLVNLYLNRLSLIVSTCVFSARPLQEMATRVSDNEWLIFTPSQTTGNITCPTSGYHPQTLRGYQTLTLQHGCILETPGLQIISRPHDSNDNLDVVHTEHHWILDNVPDLTAPEVEAAYEARKQQGQLLFKATDFSNTTVNSISPSLIGVYAIGGLILMFTFGCLIRLLYRWDQRRRARNLHLQNADDQESNNTNSEADRHFHIALQDRLDKNTNVYPSVPSK